MVRLDPSRPGQIGLLLALLMLLATASSGDAFAHASNPLFSEHAPALQATAETTASPEATFTPELTPTPTDAPTDAPSATPLTTTDVPTPTDTPTITPTDAPTDTSTETDTPVPTDEPTAEPTAALTDIPTDAATETPVPTETPVVPETPILTETPTGLSTETPLPTDTVTVTPTESPTPTPSDETEIIVEPEQAAELVADEGKLVVTFPKGAVKARVRVTFESVRGDDPVQDPQHKLVLARFRLKALRVRNERAVKNFDQPLKMTLRYDPAMLSGWNENNLQMVYWDETLARWMPLKSSVDTKSKQVMAETDHFTDFGLANAPDVMSYLPNLEGFQTDLFSGAAGYSYPLQVPPGRGGLTPRLSLSYSSASVDNLNSDLQVSYVGAGWGMDTGYVARNTHNSYPTSDDWYSIVLNGASYDLVPGTDGAYHTSKEQFWKITFANNEWTVVTNDGTTYTFGTKANSRAVEWRTDGSGSIAKDTYNWWLDKVVDVHGNEIVYSYMHEQGSNGQSCGATPSPFDNAVYPQTIQYNKSGSAYLTQITFFYTARSDYSYVIPWRQCGNAPVQLSKLDALEVKTTDNVGALALVRRYEFTYDYSTFPGVYNDHGNSTGAYGRLTLKRIKHFGADGTTKLPDTVFTYSNNRLSTGSNGIGGKVTFAYEASIADAGPFGDKYEQDYNTWNVNGCGSFCNVPAYAFWKPLHSTTTWANGDPLGKKAIKWSVGSSLSYLFWWVEPFTPGASYVMTNTLVANTTGQIQFRSWDGTSETNLTNWINVSANVGKTVVTNFAISDSARAPEIRLYTNFSPGKFLYMERTTLQPRASHHRVASKTVEDGMDSSANATYTYAYTGIASNDTAHSAAATTNEPRAKPGSQYRGHSKVTVRDPHNNETETWFKQDDSYVGRVYKTIQRDSAGNQYGVTDHTFAKTSYAVAPYPSQNPVSGDTIEFIKLTQTLVSQYDGNNGAPPRLHKTTYGYDSKGNVNVTAEYGDGASPYRTTYREFNLNNTANIWNKLARQYVNDTNGIKISETQYVYDGGSVYTDGLTKGDLTKTVVLSGAGQSFTSATFQYNAANGNLTDVWDARGNNTHTDYDATYQIFPLSVRNAKLQTATTQYNFRLGKPEMVTDVNGAVTRTEFDVFGRTLKIFAPGEAGSANATALYDYFLGSAGVPSRVHVQVRSDLGGSNPATYQHAWWLYDGRGRLIQKQAQGLGGQTILANTRFNNLGQVWRTSNPYALSGYDPLTSPQYQTPNWSQPYTQNTYDPIGRLTRTDAPGIPAPTLFEYDHGWTTVTDANGHTKDSFSDAFGRVIQVDEHNQGATSTTQYGYDALDRLVDTWDDANNNTHLTYDWLGRKLTMSDPDMGNWAYAYDNAGNLVRQTDARGNSVCFAYDELNRATQKQARQSAATCTGGTVAYTVNYGYDDTMNGNKGVGRRTSLTDPTGNTTWRYTLDGRAITTTQTIESNAYTTSATSDAMGRLRSTKYPDNEVVNQTYNAQGLLATLGSYVTASNYNAASQLTSLTFGSGVQTTYGYDSQNLRLLTLQTSGSNQNLAYTYDNAGNVKTITDNLLSQISQFNYDDLNRLQDASIAGVYAQAWSYNPIGNILTFTDGGNVKNYSYADSAHKHAVTQVGSLYMCYDQNGNMTRRNATSSACTNGDTLNYDVENRLTSITVGATTTNYFYNGDGARVKKTANGVTTYYVGNLYEYTTWAGGSSTSKFYYFGGQRIAVKQDINVSYLHGDHLGSTSKTTGASSSAQTYYPFGNIRTATGTPPTDYGYTGQKRDATANLMYYGARYYDAALGRFIQPDTIVPNPLDPQSLNRYSYVRNNPVNRIDPTGNDDCEQQSGDCNRYFHAQGLCWSMRNEDYSRPCAATVDSEEDLERLSEEHPELLTNPGLRLLFNDPDQERRLRVLDAVGIYMVAAGYTELDILVQLTRLDAMLVGNNAFDFVDDMSLALMGWHPRDSILCGINPSGCHHSILFELLNQGGTGFSPWFRDPPAAIAKGLGTQAFHFWEFVNLGFVYNHGVSFFGDVVHELAERADSSPGSSWQDLYLANVGASLGVSLQQGEVTPLQSPEWIQHHLHQSWEYWYLWRNLPYSQ